MATVTYTTPSGIQYGIFKDMLQQTHLLVAGAAGSGKSVLVNGLITTGLFDSPFDELGGTQFILIDPKRVELAPYKGVPHIIGYACEPGDMVDLLHRAVDIVEQRYRVMEKQGVLKYSGSDIYVIIEELADLMTTNRRAVQPLIQRLCQIARAARVHVVAVTQCPLVKVIPTEIKVNFDGIVALRTRCAQDSRNIIGVSGAEYLPRYGECLYYTPDLGGVYQYTVPYVTPNEKRELINHWLVQKKDLLPDPQQKQATGIFNIFRRNR